MFFTCPLNSFLRARQASKARARSKQAPGQELEEEWSCCWEWVEVMEHALSLQLSVPMVGCLWDSSSCSSGSVEKTRHEAAVLPIAPPSSSRPTGFVVVPKSFNPQLMLNKASMEAITAARLPNFGLPAHIAAMFKPKVRHSLSLRSSHGSPCICSIFSILAQVGLGSVPAATKRAQKVCCFKTFQ